MGLVEKQWLFLQDIAVLIQHAATLEGVQLTGGDLYQDNQWHEDHGRRVPHNGDPIYPHLKNGQHPKRRAIDLNLFVDGVYQTGHCDVWDELGLFWEGLRHGNRWGGNFGILDYNHFESEG